MALIKLDVYFNDITYYFIIGYFFLRGMQFKKFQGRLEKSLFFTMLNFILSIAFALTKVRESISMFLSSK